MSSPSIVAFVSAGGVPHEGDPLYEITQGRPKALIPIAGKAMIHHVVEALAGSRYVEHIIIGALDPADAALSFPFPVDYVPDTGSLMGNAEAGFAYAMEHYPDLDGVLLSSSDVPTITPEIVDALVEACFRTDHDLYYPIIERSVMEGRFPGSRRSYVRLKEGEFAGGDIFLARPTLTLSHRRKLRELTETRKNALQMARIIGLKMLLKLLLHRLSLAEAEERVNRVLSLRGKALPFPYAEVGMDVDKPFQLDIVRADLEARAR